jgi:hypothetical protein
VVDRGLSLAINPGGFHLERRMIVGERGPETIMR